MYKLRKSIARYVCFSEKNSFSPILYVYSGNNRKLLWIIIGIIKKFGTSLNFWFITHTRVYRRVHDVHVVCEINSTVNIYKREKRRRLCISLGCERDDTRLLQRDFCRRTRGITYGHFRLSGETKNRDVYTEGSSHCCSLIKSLVSRCHYLGYSENTPMTSIGKQWNKRERERERYSVRSFNKKIHYIRIYMYNTREFIVKNVLNNNDGLWWMRARQLHESRRSGGT